MYGCLECEHLIFKWKHKRAGGDIIGFFTHPSVTHGERTAAEDTAAVGQEPKRSEQVSPALSPVFFNAQLPSLALGWQPHSSLVTFAQPR